jgi:predicted secreted hydrolase
MKTDLRAFAVLFFAFVFSFPSSLAQFLPARPGYRYEFPRDYFNHAEYQTEWWYYTGNLQASNGHKFGFELTFFRQGVSRDLTAKSAWDLKDVYFAHFALSDLDGKKFFYTERTNRPGPGLAGASAQLQKVWNGNWSVTWANGAEQLQAFAGNQALNLVLVPKKRPVIHGENGVSQKSAGPGRASHYFSETRLVASGSLTFDSREYSVSGLAWMDHEFFTHQLEADQVGWDWFSIQLDDNTELMLFQIRKKNGSIDPFSAGTFVDARGRVTRLASTDFELLPSSDRWASAATKAQYPIAWRIRVPSLRLTLEATTPLRSQELVARSNMAPSYWEGAILLQGKKNASDIAGSGYLEMTGYDRPVSTRIM